MEQQFRNWLIRRGYSETGAATSYSRAISLISEHYTEQTGNHTDIYSISDQNKISEIAHDYSQAGRFSEFGYEQHGRFRNAIARYSEFFVHRSESHTHTLNQEIVPEEDNYSESDIDIVLTNFAYERDLQTTLCAQISELFPDYKIFGAANQGVEYSIENRRIDVLLEHTESGDLLVVELKSGAANYKVFGQISMYIGLLQRQFTDKKISGVIVAGAIDESLRQACETTDKVSLKIYRMSIELESA
jgi:hypothetical protein